MVTKKEIKTLLSEELHPDTIGTKHGGNSLLRWGFFYTHGKTAKQYVAKVSAVLTARQIEHKVVDSGEVWKNFKGGASVAASSHFYVEVKIT